MGNGPVSSRSTSLGLPAGRAWTPPKGRYPGVVDSPKQATLHHIVGAFVFLGAVVSGLMSPDRVPQGKLVSEGGPDEERFEDLIGESMKELEHLG